MDVMQSIKRIVKEMGENDKKDLDDVELEKILTNSLDFIQLIINLENEFNILFEDDELDPMFFSSIEALEKHIQDKLR